MYQTRIRLIGLLLSALLLSASLPAWAVSEDTPPEADVARSETVYVDIDAYGSPTSIISSVYLTNSAKSGSITDYTDLVNITNVSGREKPQTEGYAVTFKTPDGEDICYQGESLEELPFSIDIAYSLDGRPISAEEIAGQSGLVGITVKTENKTHSQQLVDGEMLDLYTPFSIVCMMTLDSSYGNVISDNAKISLESGVITAMAVMNPGLRQSLDTEDAEGFNEGFTISMEAENFELDSIMFIAMTGILDQDDLQGIDSIQDLVDALDTLNEAAGDLYVGSQDLEAGAKSYVKGMKTLSESMAAYYEGMEEFAEGLLDLADGAIQVSSGISQVNSVIQQLAGIYQALKDIFTNAGGTADRLIGEIENSIGMSLSELASGTDLEGAIYSALVEAACLGESSLADIDQAITDFTQGMDELNEGAGQVADGAWQAAQAGATLAEGAGELSEGVDSLYSAARTLSKAITQMSEGLGSLQEEGLQEVVDETSGISTSLARKDALLALANAYNAFSSTAPVANGSVQFIITTESITMEKPLATPNSTGQEGDLSEETGISNTWYENAWNGIQDWFSGAWIWMKGIFS